MNLQTWIAAIAVVLVVVLLFVIARLRRGSGGTTRAIDALDTVASWTPESTRVMTQHERKAYETLVSALPDHIVLAQVPIARFLRVPKRHSYGEWINRVGRLNADLLVCDKASEVLAVIEIHSPRDSVRSRERHARMARVLKAADIRVVVWMEGAIPSPETARAQIIPEQQPAKAPAAVPAVAPGLASNRLSTELPVAEAAELDADTHPLREPTPSTWFDDLESGPTPLGRDKK